LTLQTWYAILVSVLPFYIVKGITVTPSEVGKRDAEFVKENSWIQIFVSSKIGTYEPGIIDICHSIGIKNPKIDSWHELNKIKKNPAYQQAVIQAKLAYESEFFIN